MDPTPIAQQLAKQADTGTAAIILLCVVLCVVCWPHIVNGITRLRGRKTEISPDPLNVRNQKAPVYVTVGECNRRMCEHDQRLAKLDSEIKRSNEAVISKLDELDTRNEERSLQTHRRLDPLVEEIGRLRGKVEIIENAAVKATMGGKK